MTHLNTNLQLPVSTTSSPMEDAIVVQVEWYMGRVNLEKDEFLKQKMDDDLWVSLDVILNFPKMIRLGVTDKRRVATLLNARSTVVEVDEANSRIRPAWARRSNLIIQNVPIGTHLEQVAALFHIPSPTADPNSTLPPPVSHPAGLASIQPLSDTVWLATFDSPSGAQAALPHILDKSIGVQKITAEVHVENALPRARSDLQHNHNHNHPSVYMPPSNVHHDPANSTPTSYPQIPTIMSTPMMNGQIISPVPMPISVMHPGPDLHHQYTFNHAAATYMAPHGYAAPNVPGTRPYIGSHRGVPHGYVVGYPQPVSYDPASSMPQAHPISTHQPADQASMSMMSTTPSTSDTINVEVASGSHGSQAIPNSTSRVAQKEGSESKDIIAEPATTQARGDPALVPHVGQTPFTSAMQNPAIPGQSVEAQMMSMSIREESIRGTAAPGMEASYPPNVLIDPSQRMYNRNRSQYANMSRERTHQKVSHEGGSRQSMRGIPSNGEGRQGTHRKGKKGNRNTVRHGHMQQDRHTENRSRDGRGEGSGSDSGHRDERRNVRDDKTRPEPNLASMNFPPLPGSENLPSRKGLPNAGKTSSSRDNIAFASPTPKEQLPNGIDDSGDNVPESLEPSSESPKSRDQMADSTDFSAEQGDSSSQSKSEDADPVLHPGNAESSGSKPTRTVDLTVEAKANDQRRQSQAITSTLSYAAILRSKKPASRSHSNSVRSSTDIVQSSGEGDIPSSAGPQTANGPAKEKGPKRKKANALRNNHKPDATEKRRNLDASSGPLDRANSKSSSSSGSGQNSEALTVSNREGQSKSKPFMESSRAHSVWNNKPKSLFQPASVSPVGRPATPQQDVKAQKVTSPVSSHEEDKDNTCEAPKSQTFIEPTQKGIDIDASRANEDISRSEGASYEKASGSSSDQGTEVAAKSQDLQFKDKSVLSTDPNSSSPAKGAWATGGPRTWPKSKNDLKVHKNTTVMES